MKRNFNRRQFLRTAAGATAIAATGVPSLAGKTRTAAIIVDPADAVASSAAAQWAAGELVGALKGRGVSAHIYENAAQAPAAHLRIMSAGMVPPGATAALKSTAAHAEAVPEALALCQGRESVWACGYDARGLTYALPRTASDRSKR